MPTALHTGTLTLGDVTLGETDDNGVDWILEAITGWSDAPPSTGTVDQRSADHGGWAGQAFYAPRAIELTGAIVAADWATCGAAIDQLMAAIPLGMTDWLVVDEGYRSLQALVRQDGDPIIARSDGWARFSISLVAPDPRRYSSTQVTASTGLPVTSGGLSLPITLPLVIGATTASGRLVVTNDGNMPTRPVFAVAGPCPPFAISHGSGRRLAAPEAVGAGRTLYIDVDKRMALLDGTALRIITGSWFDLDPGVNEIQFSAATFDASAQMTISYRSAWR